MDASQTVKLVLSKVPLVTKVTLSHASGLSETSSKWDLKTALMINIMRSLLAATNDPTTLTKMQRNSMRDPGIKGRMWISKVTIPRPQEDGVRDALFKAIESLKDPGTPAGGYKEPELCPVEGCEWTGYRAGATKNTPELEVSEEQKYVEMMKEALEPAVVLYFHGGAHMLMDPCTHRKVTTRLAKLTGGRCLSIRYRLSPQNPFPAALLDALVSYFHLIYPPAGALHTAVESKHIVFSGDSAGANLCFALLQTLLEFRRQNLKIMWNGVEREVPLPAGLAGTSPWLDITHSTLSNENSKYDYLPKRKPGASVNYGFRQDDVWPSKPPRNFVYAENALACHPLVSPLAAKSWAGSPPIHINVGQENLTDENLFVARKMAKEGVVVILDQYEAMPHCFAMMPVIEGTGAAKKCWGKMGFFINAVVWKYPFFMNSAPLTTKGTFVVAKSNEEKELDMMNLTGDTDEIVLKRMHQVVEWSKVPEANMSSTAKL